MKAWLRPFGIVFYIGFFALIAALAYSLMSTGFLFAEQPGLGALRAFGVAFMAAGLTMWIMLRRAEADAETLNPLLGFLVVVGSVLALVALIFPFSAISYPLQLGGMAAALAGLVIGLLIVIAEPAFPHPVATSWPEGGTAVLTRFARAESYQDHGYGRSDESLQPEDDLTVIEGIDADIEQILNAADVYTYAELAEYEPPNLLQLLRMAEFTAPVDVTSWPVQAQLAADGDWEALRALQAELVADQPS